MLDAAAYFNHLSSRHVASHLPGPRRWQSQQPSRRPCVSPGRRRRLARRESCQPFADSWRMRCGRAPGVGGRTAGGWDQIRGLSQALLERLSRPVNSNPRWSATGSRHSGWGGRPPRRTVPLAGRAPGGSPGPCTTTCTQWRRPPASDGFATSGIRRVSTSWPRPRPANAGAGGRRRFGRGGPKYASSEEDQLQVDLRDGIRKVCGAFPDSYWRDLDERHEFPWEFYEAMAAGGWIGVAMPTDHGGGGLGITEASIVLEEVAASGAAMNGCSAIHLSMFGMNPSTSKHRLQGAAGPLLTGGRCRPAPRRLRGHRARCRYRYDQHLHEGRPRRRPLRRERPKSVDEQGTVLPEGAAARANHPALRGGQE